MSEVAGEVTQEDTGFDSFLIEAIVRGLNSDSRVLKQWADDTARAVGRGLLTLYENRDDIPAEIAEQLPNAMKDFFGALPTRMAFPELTGFIEDLSHLPDESFAAVRPHVRSMY